MGVNVCSNLFDHSNCTDLFIRYIFSLIFNVFVCRDPDYEADKWVHHLAKYEYKVEIEFVDPNKPVVPPSTTSPESPEPQSPHTPPTHADEDSSSDSSSSDEE